MRLRFLREADKQHYGSAIKLPGSFSERRSGSLVASAEAGEGDFGTDASGRVGEKNGLTGKR